MTGKSSKVILASKRSANFDFNYMVFDFRELRDQSINEYLLYRLFILFIPLLPFQNGFPVLHNPFSTGFTKNDTRVLVSLNLSLCRAKRCKRGHKIEVLLLSIISHCLIHVQLFSNLVVPDIA